MEKNHKSVHLTWTDKVTFGPCRTGIY